MFVTPRGSNLFIRQMFGCMPAYAQKPCRNTFVWPWHTNKDKDSKNRGNKDAFLPLFFCSACVAYINSQSLRRRRRSFPSASGSTMDFSERESSPKLSSSAESSVEFAAEIPGPECEEESSTIVLTDSEDGLPKPKRKLTEYFTPARRNTLPIAPRIGLTGNASTRSTDTGNPGPGTQSGSPDKAESSSSKRKSTYTTYSLRQKLEVLGYVKAHSEVKRPVPQRTYLIKPL